jgi:hypothetical protein
MTLSFSPKLEDGSDTHFLEKIIAMNCWTIEECNNFYNAFTPEQKEYYHQIFDMDYTCSCIPKIHTIRQDKSDRWKEGIMIHAVYGNRTKKRIQFAPTFPCKGVQSIEIKYLSPKSCPFIWVDKIPLGSQKVKQLAINDGFEDVFQFFDFFETGFTGKIIHFTDFRY